MLKIGKHYMGLKLPFSNSECVINIPFLKTFICAKTKQQLLVSNPSKIPEYQM